jgi:hypothetical protein
MSNATVKTVTPKGELAWVTITGEGKEDMSGNMKYQATLILDPINNPTDKAYIDSIDAFWEANRPKEKKVAKSKGYYLNDPLLDENGERQYDEEDKLIMDPKGRVNVVFKTGTTFKDGKQKKIRIFNSKNLVISLGDQSIGNGSIGHLSGAMGIYTNENKGKIVDAGVSLYLDAIQLKKFVAYTGGDAGFEASDDDEDEGFTGLDDAGFDGESATAEESPKKATPRL